MAVKKAAPAPVVEGINFGDLSQYGGGFGIPAGKYALEFEVLMYDFKNAQGNTKPPRLGVMIHAHSLTEVEHQGDKAYTQFYGMGSNAHASFQPNPETGKGLVVVPGGPGGILNDKTNWAVFLKSMYDCGLPNGVFTNSFTTIDGVHVQLTTVPEPIERQSFASKASEVAEERKPGMICVVTEIMDDGKPWENTGGLPTGVAAGTVAKPAAKVNGAPTPISKPAAEPVDETDILQAAINGASAVLEKNLKGMSKMAFRASTFTSVKATTGDDMAQAVQTQFFSNDDGVSSLLSQLGFHIEGALVKPDEA